MQLGEPVAASWKASLSLGFQKVDQKTVLAEKRSDGPLVVQKPLYPDGPQCCHAIVVHPPGGIAGGDELALEVKTESNANALLTTPGAAKWYRSAGAWARQTLRFHVAGSLEWLPRETIVFDGALAALQGRIALAEAGRFIGWEVVCLGRSGAGERYERGRVKIDTRITRGSRTLFVEKGEIEAAGRLMHSPAGLAGKAVFGTLVATCDSAEVLQGCRTIAPATMLPGLIIARYLGDSTEEAFMKFIALWKLLRPAVLQGDAVPPRIWST